MSKKVMFNRVESHVESFRNRIAEIAGVVINTDTRVKVHSFEYSSLPAREILRVSLHVKPTGEGQFSEGMQDAFDEFAVKAFQRYFNGTFNGVAEYDAQHECRVSATNYGTVDHGIRAPETFGGSILFAVTFQVNEKLDTAEPF